MFIREVSEKNIASLQKSDLFRNKLSQDIKTGKVFPAIRKERIDFYYKGGKLFSFNNTGLLTQIKYATTPEDNIKNYITEEKFSKSCGRFIKDFEKDYDKIKNNCALYSKGSESACASYLYSKYSFVKAEAEVMVLDIEISLETAEDEDGSQDRIDILLYSRKARALKFVEAKLYTNKEIRSKTRPKVIEQIKRYNNQIQRKGKKICDEYKKYVGVMNKLFALEIEKPIKVLPEVGLYIFDFDDDQKNGNLSKKINPNLNSNCVKYYCLGNPANINAQTLWNVVTKS